MASIMDLKRMCDSYGDYCTGCPLYNPKKICTPNAIIDNVDEIVDKWVAGRPVKTYAMDFFEKFPNAPRSSDGIPQTCWGHVYGDGRYCSSDACTECWNREMDGDAK
jgi:hypothetical protein